MLEKTTKPFKAIAFNQKLIRELSRLRQTDQRLQDHVPHPSNRQKVSQTI
jgi:hypothetical protein